MNDIGHNSEHVAADELKKYVERIERMEEKIRERNADKSEIYSEAKARGFDVKIMKQVVALRRKDPAERRENETVLVLYLNALGMV